MGLDMFFTPTQRICIRLFAKLVFFRLWHGVHTRFSICKNWKIFPEAVELCRQSGDVD